MPSRPSPSPPPAAARDRRSGKDRRLADKGPPSNRDRRVGVEPRKPEVCELEVSMEEWDALQSMVVPHRPAA